MLLFLLIPGVIVAFFTRHAPWKLVVGICVLALLLVQAADLTQWCVRTGFAAIDQRQWQERPGVIEQVELGSIGRPTRGVGAYSLTVRYRYDTKDGPRTGTRFSHRPQRAGTGFEKDNLHEWYERLDRARRSGATVNVWVDPQRPEHAIIDRDPPLVWFWLFGALTMAMWGLSRLGLWALRDRAAAGDGRVAGALRWPGIPSLAWSILAMLQFPIGVVLLIGPSPGNLHGLPFLVVAGLALLQAHRRWPQPASPPGSIGLE